MFIFTFIENLIINSLCMNSQKRNDEFLSCTHIKFGNSRQYGLHGKARHESQSQLRTNTPIKFPTVHSLSGQSYAAQLVRYLSSSDVGRIIDRHLKVLYIGYRVVIQDHFQVHKIKCGLCRKCEQHWKVGVYELIATTKSADRIRASQLGLRQHVSPHSLDDVNILCSLIALVPGFFNVGYIIDQYLKFLSFHLQREHSGLF